MRNSSSHHHHESRSSSPPLPSSSSSLLQSSSLQSSSLQSSSQLSSAPQSRNTKYHHKNVILTILLLCIAAIALLPLFTMYVNVTYNYIPTGVNMVLSTEQYLFMKTLHPFRISNRQNNRDEENNVEMKKDSSFLPSNQKQQPQQNHNDTITNKAYRGKLDCTRHGGALSDDVTKEMVYWKDIPSDYDRRSPYYDSNHERFLTFEADESGWNNVRMAFETTVALAIAMGRTLVLPPKQHFNYLWDLDPVKYPVSILGFEDFYNFDNLPPGLKVISFHEFLDDYVMKGKFINRQTGKPTFPPMNNRTDWTGALKNYESGSYGFGKILYGDWLRQVTLPLTWKSDDCVAIFPSKPGPDGVKHMNRMFHAILHQETRDNVQWWVRAWEYRYHPTPVNATTKERLREMLTNRHQVCMYNEEYQKADVVHVYGEQNTGYRVLIHFYAFIFTEDNVFDLYIKRYIRDYIRYVDPIHCAAGRIVQRLHEKAKQHGTADGTFDTMHIRRNDFKSAYTDVVLEAHEIYNNNTAHVISDQRTIYISTDETDTQSFNVLHQHYHLYYLHDFLDEIKDIVISNFYGLVEQTVASKGTTFVGTYYSTFSGYIHRLRGYYNSTIEQGSTNGYYFVPVHLESQRNIMTFYTPIEYQYWCREFPIGWRDINHGLEIVS